MLSRAPPPTTLLGFLCVRKKEEERNRTCFCKSYSGLKVNLYSERIDDLILIYLFIGSKGTAITSGAARE